MSRSGQLSAVFATILSLAGIFFLVVSPAMAQSVAWVSQFGGGVNGNAQTVVAVDGSGNIYIGGFTNGAFPAQTITGLTDAFILGLNVPPPDLTAPVINVTVSPSANPAGWNNTDVTVTWSVSDPDSGISSSTGCANTTVTTDTAGTTLTCTAANAYGRTASLTTRTIKLDKTPPTVAFGALSPPPNGAGWNNTNVTAPFTVTETLSGLAAGAPASPLTLSAEGAAVNQTVTVSDVAGNSVTVTSPTVKLDKTPPTASISGPTTLLVGQPGTWTTITGDSVSGVSTVVWDLNNDNVFTDATGSTASASFPSPITLPIRVRVTDNAGNVTTASITLVVTAATPTPTPTSTPTVTPTPTPTVTPTPTPTATPTPTPTPTSGFSLGAFVAFSKESTWLKSNVDVLTGDVGANTALSPNSRRDRDDDKNTDEQDKLVEVRLSERAQMLSPSSRVVGDTVALRSNAKVFNVYYNELINKKGVIQGTKTTPLNLPALTLPALPSITPGTQDIELKNKQTLTLAPGSYGNITVKEGGTLILTGGVYHVNTLDIRGKTDILFRAPSQLRVKNEMDTDNGTYIGPDPSLPGLTASDIVIYVAGTDDRGAATTTMTSAPQRCR